MENRIITISREYGSGGRAIGRKLADKLGIHCYDAELIQKIVEKSGYPADYVKEKGEDAEGGGLSMFLVDRRLGPTHQDTLWKIQSGYAVEDSEPGDFGAGGQGVVCDRRPLCGLYPASEGGLPDGFHPCGI